MAWRLRQGRNPDRSWICLAGARGHGPVFLRKREKDELTRLAREREVAFVDAFAGSCEPKFHWPSASTRAPLLEIYVGRREQPEEAVETRV
jgi:hypothetical protein